MSNPPPLIGFCPLALLTLSVCVSAVSSQLVQLLCLFWKLRADVPHVDSVWLDSALCPARSRNWHEFRIPEWKKRGEWTTRRLDYGWCVDFHFISLCPILAFGIWLLIGGSFCVGGWSLRTVFGTTAAPSMLFQKYLQCRVCCHHSCFWLVFCDLVMCPQTSQKPISSLSFVSKKGHLNDHAWLIDWSQLKVDELLQLINPNRCFSKYNL